MFFGEKCGFSLEDTYCDYSDDDEEEKVRNRKRRDSYCVVGNSNSSSLFEPFLHDIKKVNEKGKIDEEGNKKEDGEDDCALCQEKCKEERQQLQEEKKQKSQEQEKQQPQKQQPQKLEKRQSQELKKPKEQQQKEQEQKEQEHPILELSNVTESLPSSVPSPLFLSLSPRESGSDSDGESDDTESEIESENEIENKGESSVNGKERVKTERKAIQTNTTFSTHTHNHNGSSSNANYSTSNSTDKHSPEFALLWEAVEKNRKEITTLRKMVAEKEGEVVRLQTTQKEDAEKHEVILAEVNRTVEKLRAGNGELRRVNEEMMESVDKMRIKMFWVTTALGATPNMPAVIPTILDKAKGLYNILSSTHATPSKIAPEPYDVHNGILGMNCHVVIKLVDIVADTRKIRHLMGMCEQQYMWRKSPNFAWARAQHNIHIDLVPHPDCRSDFVIENKVLKVIKTSLDCARIFVRKEIRTGVYRFSCKSLVLNTCDSVGIYTYSLERPWLVKRASDWAYYVNAGNVFQNGIVMGNNPFTPNAIIDAEVNMDLRTLHFFIRGRLQPVSFKQIPSPVRFFIQFRTVGDEMEYLYLHRLPRPSFNASTPVDSVWDPRGLHLNARVVEWNWGDLRNR